MIKNILALPARIQFYRYSEWGKNVHIGWAARCINRNKRRSIRIGDHCSIWGRLECNEYGTIIIGNYTTIRFKTIIGSAERIEIGSYCIISNNCTIIDNNNHPTDPRKRKELCLSGFESALWDWKYSDKKPVIIEDNVWIGQNALILKGVRIGTGSIVGANSVVTEDVPPYTVVAGNPAKVVKKII